MAVPSASRPSVRQAHPSGVETSPWAASRRRAEALRERYDFAADVLALYLALLDVWEESSPPSNGSGPEGVAAWAAERVVPKVVAATSESGPKPLVEQLVALPVGDRDATERLLTAWLRGDDLTPVERYLARATLRGIVPAVDVAAACRDDPAPRGGRRCPECGGPPQLSVRADTGDSLVNGSRQLQCARCGHGWAYSGSTCASCGEARGGRRTVYAERRDGPQIGRGEVGDATFPHLRIEACESCRHYLIDVDLGHDPRAVPEVDELAAVPLDLYASERGLTKITPNIMGF
jgi:Protein involved in formate dehydrogenase formation